MAFRSRRSDFGVVNINILRFIVKFLVVIMMARVIFPPLMFVAIFLCACDNIADRSQSNAKEQSSPEVKDYTSLNFNRFPVYKGDLNLTADECSKVWSERVASSPVGQVTEYEMSANSTTVINGDATSTVYKGIASSSVLASNDETIKVSKSLSEGVQITASELKGQFIHSCQRIGPDWAMFMHNIALDPVPSIQAMMMIGQAMDTVEERDETLVVRAGKFNTHYGQYSLQYGSSGEGFVMDLWYVGSDFKAKVIKMTVSYKNSVSLPDNTDQTKWTELYAAEGTINIELIRFVSGQ